MTYKAITEELMANPKVATAISAGTISSGLGTFLDLIPSDIGKLATLLGVVLTVILIRSHWLNIKKLSLEMDIMKAKERDRQDAIKKRMNNDEPIRRKDDKEICDV
jgi:hypothetical protein